MTSLHKRRTIDVWPAFVDAVASLLMVVIFVVLVAAIGQLFLSDAIIDRDDALGRLNARFNDLADMLSMQQTESARISKQLALRTASLEAAEAAAAASRRTISEQADLLVTRAGVIAEQGRSLAAAEARLATLENDIAALATLKQRLQRELESSLADRDDIGGRLAEETRMNVAAQAQVVHLNRQLTELRDQLARLSHALELADAESEFNEARINDLGRRLNLALATKTAELQRYRSEFFGRLREALADYPGIRIVGDRFVLPAELLFESGSDELGPNGRQQVAQLAATLQDLARRIPDDFDWVLRIDGHTDRRPIKTERFPSNWELSAARAITIVGELIRRGIPPDRLAATGFAEHHPIDLEESPSAFARNRRIEIKLTSR